MKINKLIYYGKVTNIKIIQQLIKNYEENVRRQGSGVANDILWGRLRGETEIFRKVNRNILWKGGGRFAPMPTPLITSLR